MFEHGIEMNQQFVHRGDHRDFRQFACRAPAAIGRPNRRIVGNGGDGGHVQGGADVAAPALDAAIAAARAAVVRQRRDAHEFADLAVGQRAELWQAGQQTGRGRRPDAGDRLQQLIAHAPDRTRLNPRAQVAIRLAQLLVEPGDMRQQILAHGATGQRHAVALGRQHLDELSAAGHERVQIGLQIIGQRPGRGPDPRRKRGEDAGIEGVGLFQQPERLGESRAPAAD